MLIPSFALERAQEILFHLRNLEANGLIPSVPVYVDSPLTARISQVFEELREILGSLTVELKNAGHITGSAFVELSGEGRQLVFSDDLGNRRKELLPDADYPAPANLVLSESTYGDRSHRSFQATLEELAVVVDRALSRRQGVDTFLRTRESPGDPISPA